MWIREFLTGRACVLGGGGCMGSSSRMKQLRVSDKFPNHSITPGKREGWGR